ncbi:MAG: hypothetical protein COA79_15645 [Planctomycetota bacterium]|nr:MAG: hypothetical protein COA79_15645 [Planctomycetota bacterium]
MIVSGKKNPVSNDIELNKKNVISAIQQAIAEKSEILLTPEGCLSGYTHQFNQKELIQALEEVLQEAKKNSIGLALGTCFMKMMENVKIRFVSIKIS